MCLSTVYIGMDGERQEVMKDVAQMVFTKGGYRLVGLLGDEKFVAGNIRSVDFIDEHIVILGQGGPL